MDETVAIRLTMRAHRAGIDASAQTVGGSRSGNWSVHIDHGRRIFDTAHECQREISRLGGINRRKQAV